MRKILSLFTIVLMLFSFSSCDGLINFMGSMGNNIAGTDTSAAAAAAESLTVKDEDVKKVEEDDRIDLSTSSTDGSTTATIKLTGTNYQFENLKIQGTVESLLPAIDTTVIDTIGTAMKTDAGSQALVEEMKQTVSGAVKTAAQGTATVLVSILKEDTIQNALGGVDGSSNSMLNEAMTILTDLTTSLDNISKGGEVSKGDVVTLQLIESLATDIVKLGETTDDSGNTTLDYSSLMNNTEAIAEVLPTVNNFVTVSSAISESSQFNLNLTDIMNKLTSTLTGGSN